MYCVSFIFSLTNFITIKLKLFQYFLKLLQHFFFNISSHFRQNITTFWDQHFLINIFLTSSNIFQKSYNIFTKCWKKKLVSQAEHRRGGPPGEAPAHRVGVGLAAEHRRTRPEARPGAAAVYGVACVDAEAHAAVGQQPTMVASGAG
jgi:hypothetical protein